MANPAMITPTGNGIQEAHPLKQGLKHATLSTSRVSVTIIQEAHPLKQGLKHTGGRSSGYEYGDSRGTSTKTRIETL